MNVFKIVKEYIEWPDLKSLFNSRELTYHIRNPRPIREESYCTNYTFCSPTARLRRDRKTLPQSMRDTMSIGEFKYKIRQHLNK